MSSKRCQPLPVAERILAEAGAHYTRELVFSPATAMKSRSAYYTRVCIISEISWYSYFTALTTEEVCLMPKCPNL